jgi:hypothetical protein
MAVDYEAAEKIINEYISEVKAAIPIDKVYLYGSYDGTAMLICVFFPKNLKIKIFLTRLTNFGL